MERILISLKKDRSSLLTVSLFLFLSLWWFLIFLSGTTDALINHIFGFVYGGFSLWGGFWGLRVSKLWGGNRSLMGKAILYISIGLLFQAFGQYSFWFFNYILRIAVPYPGIPDIGYFGTIPFYIYAAVLLAKASGVEVSLKNFSSQIVAIIIPIAMLILSYFLFLKEYAVDLSAPLKTLLDFGYPMGQAIYISIAILTYKLSSGILGGIMKNRILIILFAFMAQYLADYIFVYFHDLYFPASFFDFLYLIAYFLMTLGLLQLKVVVTKLKNH